MFQILLKEARGRPSHAHGLFFEGLAHSTPTTIDGGPDADSGHVADKPVAEGIELNLCHLGISLLLAVVW
jgi:hypothetical protein